MATSSATKETEFEEFSLALLNINGLRYKTDDVRHIITHHQLHVLALCETKLDSSVPDSQVYIEGFRMWRRDRDSDGGGVALYVQDHIETRLRSDLIKTEVEIIWVEMKLPDSKPVLLGCCYRPPNVRKAYLNQIKEIMDELSMEKEEKDILLMGDFNVDWKSEDRKKMSFMSEFGFEQIVDDYTRLTPESETCIDHIYTNIPHQCSKIKSTVTGCSDHNLVTVMVNKKIPKRRSGLKETFDQNKFKKKIQSALRENREIAADPREALSKFTKSFVKVANEFAPLENQDIYGSLRLDQNKEMLIFERDQEKKNKIKRNHHEEPFKSKEFISISDNGREHPTSEGGEDEQETKSERWKRQKEPILKYSEKPQKESLQQELKKAHCSPERLLKVFKACLGERLPSHVISITPEADVTSGTEHLQNLSQICNETSNPESVSEGSQVQQMMQNRSNEFSFGEIDNETVKRSLVCLCDHVNNITEGIDPTEAELMKVVADHISGPISHILNRFINHEQFPAELQIFPPLANKYSYHSGANIYIMVGLIFDSILSMQIKQFFTEMIPAATDEDEIKRIQTDWVTEDNRRKTVHAVFLDFSSLFENIKHDLLINQLRTFGFSSSAVSLIETFLPRGSCGLPKGSLLARVLFTIFLNDHRSILAHSSSALSENHLMIYYMEEDHGKLEANKQYMLKWAKTKQDCLNKTIITTLPKKRRTLINIFEFLLSFSLSHSLHFNSSWIQRLKIILLCKDSWENEFDKILKELQKYFGMQCLDAVNKKVKNSVINSLVQIELMSRPQEQASYVVFSPSVPFSEFCKWNYFF